MFEWLPGDHKTYSDFLATTIAEREEALVWLRGERNLYHIFTKLSLDFMAANDNMTKGCLSLIDDDHMTAMLYCWLDCEKDETLARLTFDHHHLDRWIEFSGLFKL